MHEPLFALGENPFLDVFMLNTQESRREFQNRILLLLCNTRKVFCEPSSTHPRYIGVEYFPRNHPQTQPRYRPCLKSMTMWECSFSGTLLRIFHFHFLQLQIICWDLQVTQTLPKMTTHYLRLWSASFSFNLVRTRGALIGGLSIKSQSERTEPCWKWVSMSTLSMSMCVSAATAKIAICSLSHYFGVNSAQKQEWKSIFASYGSYIYMDGKVISWRRQWKSWHSSPQRVLHFTV